MIKETITYTDFNGNEHTEDYWFNLSRSELLKMDTLYPNGLAEKLNEITKSEDRKGMLDIFELLLSKSYGVKSADGTRFDKNQTILDAFVSSPAYDEIFMRLATSEEEASRFINGIIPASLQNAAALASMN